jgi:hypothetical protein
LPFFDDDHLCKGNSVNQYLLAPVNLHITSLQWRTLYEIMVGARAEGTEKFKIWKPEMAFAAF